MTRGAVEFMKERPMNIIDLSHRLSEQTPVYPGTSAPIFQTETSIRDHGFAETRLGITSHTGTHLDVPAHIFPHGRNLDQFELGAFAGPGCVVDVTHRAGGEITVEDVEAHLDLIAGAGFILLRTDWDRYWRRPEYFHDYPVLSEKAAARLAALRIKGVGVDAISVDVGGSTTLPNHVALLGSEVIVVENLTRLADLPERGFTFLCLPLKLAAGDGSPVRAAAIIQ